MPRFKEMERKSRSILWAMWSEQRRRARNRQTGSGARWSLFVTLAGGMEEFVESIAKRLPEGAVRLNTQVTKITVDASAGWLVTTSENEVLKASAVILATPAFRTAEILGSAAADAASELRQISCASTATVNLAYRCQDFPRALDSFGFVVPAVEERQIMACTFSSLKYPARAPEGHALLRAFIGGTLQPELFQSDDATMVKNARAELASLLNVNAQPLFSRVWRHPNSMPQYHVGHEERIQRIETALATCSGLALAGSAYHGVGISDCVRMGEEAAAKLIDHLDVTRG
jgi:oxygen-dependent protoporphyrinogen oxidase